MDVFKAYIALFEAKNVNIGIHSVPKLLTSGHPTNLSLQSFRTETRPGHSRTYIALFALKNSDIGPK